MKILYAGTLPPHPGGSAMVGAQLLPAFVRAGHSVRAVAPITETALESGDRFHRQHPELAVRRFLVPYFESAPNHPASEEYRRREGERLSAELRASIAAERPDILIIGRETFAWHVPRVADEHGIPTVLLIHGSTGRGMLDGSFPGELAERLRAELRRASALVLVARHLIEPYRRWGFERLHVVQNGVDLERFRPTAKHPRLLHSLGIPEDAVVIAHASNMKDLKRPLDLAHSAERALRHDPRLVYLIIGDGPLREPMERLCHSTGIRESFRFTGWVEPDQMPDHLNLADVVAMPSESEALALVYLETMACGRVLLASDIAAAHEVIADGSSGILFRKADVEDLTAKTLQLAAGRALRERIGCRAREAAAEHDLEDTVRAYLSILEDVVTRARG